MLRSPVSTVFLLLLLSLCSAEDTWKRIVVERPPGTRYKPILTLDGGGLRLHMTNQILIEVEKQIAQYYLKHPELLPPEAKSISHIAQLEVHLADFFNCIGGVSAGSWTGLYYASKGKGAADVLAKPEVVRKYGEIYPGSAKGLNVFFVEYGGVIFPQGFYHLLPTIEPWRPKSPIRLPGINRPLYSPDGVERALHAFLGDIKMSELETSCVVNVYDVDHASSVLFTFSNDVKIPHPSATIVRSKTAPRYYMPEQLEEVLLADLRSFTRYRPDLDIRYGEDFYIRDVARASSSLPAYWVAKEVKAVNKDSNYSSYTCIDGGLLVSNPTMHSSNLMMQMQTQLDLFEFSILSLGSGVVLGEWSENVGRGAVGWLRSGDLVNIVINGGSEAMQANLDFFLYSGLQFPLGQYVRIQTFAQHDTREGDALSTFDDVSQLSILEQLGKSTARKYKNEIRNFIQNFMMATESAIPSAT